MNAKTKPVTKKDKPAQHQEPHYKEGSELVSFMAKSQHMDSNAYASTVMKSCFDIKDPQTKQPVSPTREQFLAFLMIAREHDLNPITREIYAFESRGKIQPIVSIDGWLKIINEHPQFDGMDFKDETDDDGNLLAVTCTMYRKDRTHPIRVTEYLSECERPTEPWKKWPIRMLRHKATIQCARYAFGFSGIVDQDEADRIREANSTIEGTATVVEDAAPASASQRLVNQLRDKDAPAENAAPERSQSVEVTQNGEGNAVEFDQDALTPKEEAALGNAMAEHNAKNDKAIAAAESEVVDDEWVRDYDAAEGLEPADEKG